MNFTIDSFYSGLEENWRILNSDKYRYDLPLTHSILPTLLITGSYLLFVLKLGPAYMKSRPAYNVKWIMLTYNLAQILINFYVACRGLYVFLWLRPFNIGCITILPIEHSLKSLEISLCYIFYLLKFFDLLDTVFFVLRKNFKQITFLHVYHHFMMSSFGIIYIKWVGLGGHAMSFGVVNTIVHSFMYTYYFISALYPESRGKLWWKRYITKLQITQFFVLLLHSVWPLLFKPDCPYPTWLLKLAIVQLTLMILLFLRFYNIAYLKKHNQELSVKAGSKLKLFNIGDKLD